MPGLGSATRILIVEDIERTLRQAERLLAESLDNVAITTAETVSEAMKVIGEAESNGQVFEVAIVDFMLPLESGREPHMDRDVRMRLREFMPDGLLLYVTAYADDDEVKEYLLDVELGDSSGPRAVRLPKDENWGYPPS